MKLTIIVPAFNEEAYLVRTLETIVVDNNGLFAGEGEILR